MRSGAFRGWQQTFAEPSIVAGKSPDEPRSPILVFLYPHMRLSLEPKLLREGIWMATRGACRRFLRWPRRKMDIPQIAGRRPLSEVYNLAFKVSWKRDQAYTCRLSVAK